MSMIRIYVPGICENSKLCKIASDQARYLTSVLRMKHGGLLRIFDGKGWEYDAVIRHDATEGICLEIAGRHASPAAEIHITLCQALPKGDKLDGIIRHATELGVERIIPFFAERSVPHMEPERLTRKRQRWQKIAIDASRQCGRSDIPEIAEITTFESMLRSVPQNGLRLIPWEAERTTQLHTVLQNAATSDIKEFVVVIGPEGGFSAEEIEESMLTGFISVSLGRRVLRVETASLALLSILQYEMGARETNPKYDRTN